MGIIQILLTIILPPLAVLLSHGLGKHFIINLILTLFGWLPGVVHAFYIQSAK